MNKQKEVPFTKKDIYKIMRFLLFLLFFLTMNIFGQSYEGYIGDFPIWFEIDKPAKNGELKGSYFYKNQFIPIILKGNKIGNQINLSEYNRSGKKTGVFVVTYNPDSLIGKWSNANGSASYTVLLGKTDSKYKPCEKLNYGKATVDSSDEFFIEKRDVDLELSKKT
jgi:hypothetical protein